MVNKKASILLLVLWLFSLLGFFSLILSQSVRQKILMLKRLEQRDKGHYIAEAGVKRAIVEVRKQRENNFNAFKDSWANDTAIFRAQEISGGAFSIWYNYDDPMTGIKLERWGLIDEESKINLNFADRETLERFFKKAARLDEIISQELAASIIDWRDADSQLSIPIGSAEDSFYRGLSYPYEAKDDKFDLLDELLLVKGMSPALYESVRDYFTVYGSGSVNVNTALKPVFLALGLSNEMADKIAYYRAGADKIFGTQDDLVFNGAAEIVPKLSQAYNLSVNEAAELSRVSEQYFSAKSDNFKAKSLASLGIKGNTIRQIECVFNSSGKVLYWQES